MCVCLSVALPRCLSLSLSACPFHLPACPHRHQVVGTVAVAAGRYELESELSLGPSDNGMTFEGAPGAVISGQCFTSSLNC